MLGMTLLCQMIRENLARPREKRIPIPLISLSITTLLSSRFLGLDRSSNHYNNGTSSRPPRGTATTPSTLNPNPLVLRLRELHRIVIKFWIKIWVESDSTMNLLEDGEEEGGRGGGDFERLKGLVKSQLEIAVGEREKSIDEIQRCVQICGISVTNLSSLTGFQLVRRHREFEGVNYKTLRARQIKEFELRDDLTRKKPVKYDHLFFSSPLEDFASVLC